MMRWCMSIMRSALKLVLFSLALPLGCGGAQQSSPSESGWHGDLADPSVEPLDQKDEPERKSDAPVPISGPQTTPPTEMRVRHDLMLAKDSAREAACSCLAVVVASSPTDPRLSWIDAPPKLESDVALVAVSSKGIACPGLPADTTERPSISGVEKDGADVVITIENVPPGRPVATGAVIPKPQAGGSIYVKSKSAKVLYGKPLTGAGRCKVR